METLTLTVPRRGISFWLDVKEVGPSVVSFKQYVGPRFTADQECNIQVGAIVLKAWSASFNLGCIKYTVCTLLPNGEWHEIIDCVPPKCGQLLRERIRTWLTLSLESRVIRAVSEIIDELNKEIDEYLNEDTSHNMEDPFVYTRHTQSDELIDMSTAATGKKIVNVEELFDEFQQWLEAVSRRTGRPPSEVYDMLIQGAQRTKVPHVNYLKKFNRAIRFQDNINE